MTMATIRMDSKDEQSNWSFILDGVAGLTDADPHIDQRGGQPEHEEQEADAPH